MEKQIKNIIQMLSENSDTPFYLFSKETFERQIAGMRTKIGSGAGLCYAMKCNPFMTPVAGGLVDRIEVCSYGEYCICRRNQVAPEKLLISGVLKKPDEMERVIRECGSRAGYTAESPQQFSLLCALAEKYRTRIRVYLRLTSGNQFGMDEETICELLKSVRADGWVQIAGLHYYSGSQKRKPDKNVRELQKLDAILLRLQDMFQMNISELEYGPGIPAGYFEGQEEHPEAGFLQEIMGAVRQMQWKGRVTLEMGRICAASCGYYATRVCEVKQSCGVHYCITDGGMHQLQYDGQIRGMYHPHVEALYRHARGAAADAETTGRPEEWTICGCLCTVNDVLTAQADLGDLEPGDILVFKNAGAYSMVEGMALFLSHELPAVYLYSGRDGIKPLRREVPCWTWNTEEFV
ncbi:MAG: alanine racemase [Eubacterium sp.]|nr:alanine racemase [Eubacterium sp.]